MLTKDDKKWIDGRRNADRKWVKANTVSRADLKKGLTRYATKADLNETKVELKDEISGSRIFFRNEMAKMEQKIEDKAASRHNELMDLFDGLAKEVKNNEEFRLVTNHRLDRLEGVSLDA